jgi:tRNA (guanine37-N1)-methyltransferase
LKITVLTLFPEMIKPVLNASILKRAQAEEAVSFELINFRDFSTNKHQTVDDTPYGGGAGMVLSVEPIDLALKSIDDYKDAYKILLSPQGKPYTQQTAKKLKHHQHIILICGHYEGFDERVRSLIDEEISIGDYVLTGGEIAAMAVIDSVVRLLPGVLGDENSFINDSFYTDLLDYPQYTKPRSYQGMDVPEVLLSGHHQRINDWRNAQRIERTKSRRPDLYKNFLKDEKKQ